jgi:hypothetical protein
MSDNKFAALVLFLILGTWIGLIWLANCMALDQYCIL